MLDDKQCLMSTLPCSEGMSKIGKLIHRIPVSSCFGHLTSMRCQSEMAKGEVGLYV